MIGHLEINNDFLTIIEKSQEMIFFVKKNGDIIYSSNAVSRLLGFSHQEYVNLNLRQIIHPEDLPQLEAQLKNLLKYPEIPLDYHSRKINKLGEYYWVEGSFTNMFEKDGTGFIILKFKDITARKNLELQQQSEIRDLIKRNQELNQFVYIISHNLRTPVSNLIGLINIIEDDQLDDYNKGIVRLFKTAIDSLNETIFDLTQLLSLKDKQGAAVVRINFEELFKKVCSSFNEQIEQLGITIIPNFSCSHVLFNKSYLESILTNLLSNSIKYRNPDRLLEVRVNLQIDEQHNCILTFSDNGMGMDIDSNKDELFGLHQRFHNHVSGHGVGLFITKSQITSLGGTIEVNSKVNQGTTFLITFRGKLTS